MVNNFERVLEETRVEAEKIAKNCGLEPDEAVKLIMEIVNLEDQNRIRTVAGINKKVKAMIENVAKFNFPDEST